MICPKCHTVNDEKEKFCKNCGFQLNSSRICPTCGKTNDSNSKYCKECGTVLTPVNTFRKQIIEENTKQSFFSMYKVPIICALLILLAVGAVAGMAFYNGNSGGDDGFSSLIPTDNNTGGFFIDDNDPTQAQMQENETNETNQTNDTNASKTLTEKVENKTNQTVNKTNDTNKSKTLTEKVENKTKAVQNKTKEVKNNTKTDTNNKTKDKSSSDSKSNSSKSITEKVNKSEPKSNQGNKNPIGSNDSNNTSILPVIDFNDSDDVNDSDDLNDSEDDLNDSDNLTNDSDDNISAVIGDLEDDLNDTEDLLNDSEDELSEIEMTDVPNLAQKVAETGYSFSTIEYQGNEYTKAQCIYIFSEYLLNVDKNKNTPIEVEDFDEASNPSGKDSSQSIEKSEYLSIANRVHSWMDSQDSVPNYVGVTQAGEADLSPNKMLKLFTLATLEYAVTGDLPQSVDI